MYEPSKIWDGVAAQLFVGADPGTDLGYTGDVSIAIERSFNDVKASQTGEQVLDRRNNGLTYRVAVDFKEVGEANYFADWWLTGNPAGKLHPGSIGSSVPTKRLRCHPKILGADTTKDMVFEVLVFDRGPSMVLNGKGDHVHRIEFITLPVAADLATTVNLGQLGYVAP